MIPENALNKIRNIDPYPTELEVNPVQQGSLSYESDHYIRKKNSSTNAFVEFYMFKFDLEEKERQKNIKIQQILNSQKAMKIDEDYLPQMDFKGILI